MAQMLLNIIVLIQTTIYTAIIIVELKDKNK